MIKFQIINNKLVLEPKILLIDCFNKLNKLDEINNTYLKYVFFICDITDDNPYSNLEDAERETEAKKQCFNNKDFKFKENVEELLNECYEQYKLCNNTSDERLIKTYDDTIDLMRKQMELNPPKMLEFFSERTRETKFVDNFKVHTDALIKIETISKAKDAAIARMKNKKEIAKTRGEQELGLASRRIIRGKDKK